jgi:hypothetical protein
MVQEIDQNKRKNKEKNRMNRLLKALGVKEERQKLLQKVIEQTAWMCVKLEDAAEEIGEDSLTEPYDNGGGQTGIRQSPSFQGYEMLWKSYMTGMRAIIDAIPEEKRTDAGKGSGARPPESVLQLIQTKHRREG